MLTRRDLVATVLIPATQITSSKVAGMALGDPLADAVSDRADLVLGRLMEFLRPSLASFSENQFGAWQTFVCLMSGRSNDSVRIANERLLALLTPFLAEDYWVATKGSDERLYWQQSLLIKLLMSARCRPSLSVACSDAIKRLLWNFLNGYHREEDELEMGSIEDRHLRRIYGSDNHDIIRRSFFLLGSQILAEDPSYSSRLLPSGRTIEMERSRWEENLVRYFPERASKGFIAETASPSYAGVYLQSALLIYDHSSSAMVRQSCRAFLDLFFADAAQETLHGIRAGARSRAYKDADGYDNFGDRLLLPLFILSGIPSDGELFPLRRGYIPPRDCLAVLDTTYRLPEVVRELFLFRPSMGVFEYRSRRPFTGSLIEADFKESVLPIYVPDNPSFGVRASWVTPDYILGWFTLDESRPSLLVQSQNEQICAVTSFDIGRISITGFPTSPDHRTSYADFQTVGAAGALLIRRGLKSSSHRGFRIYLSRDFRVVRRDGWLLAVAGDERSWFAFRAVGTLGTSEAVLLADDWSASVPGSRRLEGHFLSSTEGSILIVESGGAFTGSYDRFVEEVTSVSSVQRKDGEVSYWSGPNKKKLTIFHGARVPEVDGKAVAVPLGEVYQSPFLMSDSVYSKYTVRSPSGRSYVVKFP